MKLKSLNDLFIALLKDIYSAEVQISKKGLPHMIKASEGELKKGFELHLQQTEGQIKRLEQIAETMNITLTGKKCVGMEGIIMEGEEDIKLQPEGDVAIAALATAAQKVEHYEIVSYESAILLSQKIGQPDIEKLLKETLKEEQLTADKLKMMAKNIKEETMA